MLQISAEPTTKEWTERLKEELACLVQYVKQNKADDMDWFTIKPSADGVEWRGTCWSVHDMLRYEFEFEFDLPAAYPTTAPDIRIPSLEGKTAKMYRGGAICLTVHFKPLWARNAPRFGIAHALCLGLAPWLAAEIPHLVATGAARPAH